MAKSSTNKKRETLTEVTHGPGYDDLMRAITDLMNGAALPHIPEFGNGFRMYPVRITAIRLYTDPKSDLQVCDIVGVFDCRDCTPSYNPGPNKVYIEGYSWHTRRAKRADIVRG